MKHSQIVNAKILDHAHDASFAGFNCTSCDSDKTIEILVRTLLFGRCNKFVSKSFRNTWDDDHGVKDSLVFVRKMNLDEDKDNIIRILEEDGFIHGDRARKIEYFIQTNAKLDVIVMQNETNRCTCVYTGRYNYTQWHLVLCTFKMLLPWYFTENDLNEKEKALLMSLSRPETDTFVQIADEIFGSLDIRNITIDNLLGDYEVKTKKIRIDSLKDQSESIKRSICDERENVERHMRYLREKVQRQKEIDSALTAMINEVESIHCGSVAEYFKSNKKLTIVSANDERMTVLVNGYLSNWDISYLNGIERQDSVFYEKRGRVSVDDAKIIHRSIFLDECVKVRIQAAFTYEYGVGVNPLTEGNFTYSDISRIQNKHITQYGCVGSYDEIFQDAVYRGDDLDVFEAMIASAESITLSDHIVVRAFFGSLFDECYDKPIFELPDKTTISPKDYVAKVKEGAQS